MEGNAAANDFLPTRRVGNAAYENETREERIPYFPFNAAVEAGILSNIDSLARPIERPPGEYFASATLPNFEGRGLVKQGGGELLAFDLVAAEFRGNELYILPASKKSFDGDKICRDGLIIMTRRRHESENNYGRLKIAAAVLDYERYWFYIDRMRKSRQIATTVGQRAICLGNNMEWPVYEITDIDSKTGEEKAKTNNKIFSFR